MNEVQTNITGTLGYLIFDNPDRHNALPQRAWEAIPQQLDNLVKRGARVIIVKGEGAVFCAGADISEFDIVRKNAETAAIYEANNSKAFAAIRQAPVPTIAQIRGYCLGGGFGIAAACDLRIAGRSAQFAIPAAKLSLAYPADAMADIVNAIGAQNAKQILFTARQYSASEIDEFGFLSELVDDADLEDTVTGLANKITRNAPLTHHASKAAIAAVLDLGSTQTAEQLGNATFDSRDYKEGRAAFREKRPPEFDGS